MKHQFEVTPVDYNDIEARARKLRAEALNAHARAVGAWLREAFHAPMLNRRGNV